MNLDRLGLLGLIALIIAVTGIWSYLVRLGAAQHPDSPVAQAAIHFW